jgi:hypothetical protein
VGLEHINKLFDQTVSSVFRCVFNNFSENCFWCALRCWFCMFLHLFYFRPVLTVWYILFVSTFVLLRICSDSMVYFVCFYSCFTLHLFRQYGIFSLFLLLFYLGPVPTVWYILFVSTFVLLRTCSDSMVYFVCFYICFTLDLFWQYGIFCLFLLLFYFGPVPTVWYILFVSTFVLLRTCSDSMVYFVCFYFCFT